MNTRLANFMLAVASDPQMLEDFNNPNQRDTVIDQGDLSAEDKAALKSGDPSAVLQQLDAGGDVSWVVTPSGSSGFLMAFGIKIPGTGPIGARTASRTASSGGAKKQTKGKGGKSKGAKRTPAKTRRPKSRR